MWLVWVVWLGFGWFFGGVAGAGLFGGVLFRFVGVFFSNYIKSIASLFWGNCSGREDILPDIFPPSRDCLLICLQLHIWLRCMKSLNCLDYMMWRREMYNWEEMSQHVRHVQSGLCLPSVLQNVSKLLILWRLVKAGGLCSAPTFCMHHYQLLWDITEEVSGLPGWPILSLGSPRIQEALGLWYFFSLA